WLPARDVRYACSRLGAAGRRKPTSAIAPDESSAGSRRPLYCSTLLAWRWCEGIRTRGLVTIAPPLPATRGALGPGCRMALRSLHLLPTDTRAAIRRRNGLADQFLDIAQQS